MSAPQKVTRFDQSQDERAVRVWSVVEDHRPESEVFALKYGSLILAVPTVITGFLSQRFFNRRFKIGGNNMFTYVPMLIPSIGTGLSHRKMIEEDILFEQTQCVGCTEFKCASLHVLSGVVWSFILSSFAGAMIGSLKKTVYVPPIDKYPLETLKLVGKHFKRFSPTAIALSLGNFAYALVLTNLEIEQYKTMKNRMLVLLNAFEVEVQPTEFDAELSS